MRLLVGVGALIITMLLVLEIIYFRRAIFILSIPTVVVACTVAGIIRQNRRFIWPIVGISVSFISPTKRLVVSSLRILLRRANILVLLLLQAFVHNHGLELGI